MPKPKMWPAEDFGNAPPPLASIKKRLGEGVGAIGVIGAKFALTSHAPATETDLDYPEPEATTGIHARDRL